MGKNWQRPARSMKCKNEGAIQPRTFRHASPFTKVRARPVLHVQTLDARLIVSSRFLCGLSVHIRAVWLLWILYRTCTVCRDWLLCYPMVYHCGYCCTITVHEIEEFVEHLWNPFALYLFLLTQSTATSQ